MVAPLHRQSSQTNRPLSFPTGAQARLVSLDRASSRGRGLCRCSGLKGTTRVKPG